MIPKTIHYCWFGGGPLPPLALRCIESWQRYFPGWEIKRWDESNYDTSATAYSREAYACGKYAFVSDVARFDILHRCGGVYFDTDVEVIRSFDDILAAGPFMGQEGKLVNPGLGMGAEAGMPFLAEMLEYYGKIHFADESGKPLGGTVVGHTTEVLMRHGYECDGAMHRVAGFTIYPNRWMNPLDDITGKLIIGKETHSIHHYAKTWCDNAAPWRVRLSRMSHRLIGLKASACISKLLKI